MKKQTQVQALLDFAIQHRIGSGVAATWGNLDKTQSEQTVYSGKTCHQNQYSTVINENTFFDLASLTKIIATTSVVMKLVDLGRLDLLEPVFQEGFSVAHVLSHTSGLPAWNSYYETLKQQYGASLPFVSVRERARFFDDLVLKTKMDAKVGERVLYSDVGFLRLGIYLEQHYLEQQGGLFESLVQSLVLNCMPPNTLHFRPVITDAGRHRVASSNIARFAATELCPWRGLIQGQVHDDNTWARGGVAPHAGLFGTIQDVRSWVKMVFGGQGFVSPTTLRKFTVEVNAPTFTGTGLSRRTFGFDMPTVDGNGSTLKSFSMNSVGHLGFTGTSLWVDLDTGDYAVLLTNRVHPKRDDLRIRTFRQDFHRLVRSR